MIEIWQPRYKDNKVLVATHKVKNGVNRMKFTKAKHLDGAIFEFDAEMARKCPVQKNGAIDVYQIPMAELRRVN